MTGQLRLECELIRRQKSWKTQLYLGLFFALLVVLRLALPVYSRRGKLLSQGWLHELDMDECGSMPAC